MNVGGQALIEVEDGTPHVGQSRRCPAAGRHRTRTAGTSNGGPVLDGGTAEGASADGVMHASRECVTVRSGSASGPARVVSLEHPLLRSCRVRGTNRVRTTPEPGKAQAR
jgi:hypothetical protein